MLVNLSGTVVSIFTADSDTAALFSKWSVSLFPFHLFSTLFNYVSTLFDEFCIFFFIDSSVWSQSSCQSPVLTSSRRSHHCCHTPLLCSHWGSHRHSHRYLGDTSAVKLPDFKPVFEASDCFKVVNVVGSQFGKCYVLLREAPLLMVRWLCVLSLCCPNRAVLSNLLTQPEVDNPDLFQFSSRALGHAWRRVQPDLHEAVKDALTTLDPSGKLAATTLKAILKQWRVCASVRSNHHQFFYYGSVIQT